MPQPTQPPPQTPPSDQPPPPTPAPQPPTPPPAVNQPPESIPYARFKELNDQHRATQQELEKLRQAEEERKNAQLSEVERERKGREKAEARAQELEAQLKHMQRSGWVRDAAVAAGFRDPDDAVAFVSLDDLKDEEAAREAVTALAERKRHLLGAEQPQAPSPLGTLSGTTPPSNGTGDQKADLGRDLFRLARGR